MTVLATAGTASTTPATPPRQARPVLEVVHEHDWRLVQVDWSDGACIKEFSCAGCSGVWFA